MRAASCFAYSTLLGAALLSVGACGGGLSGSPSATLRSYARAIEDGRTEDAYALLSTDAKRTISPDAFRRMVLESPHDAKEMARALARPASDPIITAIATTPQGDEVVLYYEHGAWRVDGASIDLYSQATPRQAIQAFVRAYERKRYDILLRFVPDDKRRADATAPPLDDARLRASWEGEQRDEMQRIAAGVKAALATSSVEEVGDRATLAYGGQGTLQLIREHGLWKVESFNLAQCPVALPTATSSLAAQRACARLRCSPADLFVRKPNGRCFREPLRGMGPRIITSQPHGARPGRKAAKVSG